MHEEGVTGSDTEVQQIALEIACSE
jgi:hypothetical protein